MDIDELTKRFTYHAPKGDQLQRYQEIRTAALNFALVLENLVPDGREKSTAITKLAEVVMHANAGIAIGEA